VKDENELIVPARDGALRVLRASHNAGVERVVLTSSLSAIIYGNDRSHLFTEADWSNLDGKRIGAYDKSKTIAERAPGSTWRPSRIRRRWSRGHQSRSGPGSAAGRAIGGTSAEMVKRILDHKVPAIPNIGFAHRRRSRRGERSRHGDGEPECRRPTFHLR